jgi:Bacterial transcriptional regulator
VVTLGKPVLEFGAAAPLLHALTDRFDETTYMAIRRAHQVVFQDKADCCQRIRYVIELNEAFPLTTGAAGPAILSALPREEIEEVIAGGLPAYTSMSITDPDEYRAQLDQDRRLGYAYAKIDRLTPSAVRAIGPAVRDAAGTAPPTEKSGGVYRPKAPPSTRITSPMAISTTGMMAWPQRDRRLATAGRVATYRARAHHTATQIKKTTEYPAIPDRPAMAKTGTYTPMLSPPLANVTVATVITPTPS